MSSQMLAEHQGPFDAGPPLRLVPLATHETSWAPSSAKLAMHATLDACIVPDANGAARVDTAHVVVLDNFISEAERSELLDFITEPGWDHTRGPPPGKWQRSTRDRTDAAPTWGLTGDWLHRLATEQLRARVEVQSRLAALYPDYLIAHMPSSDIQVQAEMAATSAGAAGMADEQEAEAGAGESGMVVDDMQPGEGEYAGEGDGGGDASPAGSRDAEDDEEEQADEMPQAGGTSVDCNQFVANAAVHGDSYSWHVDADPSTLPYPSPWTLEYGQYVNREPGLPLFVSLLLYLNPTWERHWDAETLFLDTPSDCGVVVRPKPYRAVLLDQDVLHRLSPPSAAAGGRPRYSLVWKLVFLPRRPGQRVSLARRDWGRPAAFGSAALLDRVIAGLHSGSGGGAGGSGAGGGGHGGGRATYDEGIGAGCVGGDGTGDGGAAEGGGRAGDAQAQTAQLDQQRAGAARGADAVSARVVEAAGRKSAISELGDVPSPQRPPSEQHQTAEAVADKQAATVGDAAAAKPLSAAAKKRKRRAEAARRKKAKLAAGDGGPGRAGEVDEASPGPASTVAADEDGPGGAAAVGGEREECSYTQGEADGSGRLAGSAAGTPPAAVAGGQAPGEVQQQQQQQQQQPVAGKGAAGPVAPPGQGKRKGKRGGVRVKRKKELAVVRATAALPPAPIGPWASRWGPPPITAATLRIQQQRQHPVQDNAQMQLPHAQHPLQLVARLLAGSASRLPSADGKEADATGPSPAALGSATAGPESRQGCDGQQACGSAGD